MIAAMYVVLVGLTRLAFSVFTTANVTGLSLAFTSALAVGAAGPEMAALDRFYTNVTWTGTIEPNGMGPGSPAMTARGRGVHSRLHDGLWIVGDYRQDLFLTDGTFVLIWRLHRVTGWDTDSGQYRATLNDNYATPTSCAAALTATA